MSRYNSGMSKQTKTIVYVVIGLAVIAALVLGVLAFANAVNPFIGVEEATKTAAAIL